MFWIFIAITAHFFWALVNIGDKYILVNKIKNPYVYIVFLTWLGLIVIFFIPFVSFIVPSGRLFFWLSLAAAFHFFGGLPYVRAMQIEEATRINIWWNLIPVYSFIIAWLFIGEELNHIQIIAFVLLIIGAIVASIHIGKKIISFSKAFWLMVISCLSYAIYAVILRNITKDMSFISVFIWINALMIFMTSFLFVNKKFRKDIKFELINLRNTLALTIIGIALLDIFGILFNIWALSLGPVALVFAMEGWQVLFVFVLVIFISLFNPKLLEEKLDKKNILLKLLAMTIMITGIILINLS